MRTHRRTTAIAVSGFTALMGMGLVIGAQPAAAATAGSAGSDCGTSSTQADGQLDGAQLQACLLGRVQSSLASDEAPAPEGAPAVELAAAVEVSAFNALDVVFRVEVEVPTVGGPIEPAAEAVPADTGFGGAFAALRDCESGGDYGIDTGNGYYGAYQFSLSTWESLGYGGYPHEASPAVQDQAAIELQSLYGWGQWPGCSWYLGL